MYHRHIFTLFVLMLVALHCRGPEGPVGPPGPGWESLTDPSIKPKVIYTYPPINSTGPYEDLYLLRCGWEFCYYISQFQARFNKIMDVASVRRAVKISSSLGDIRSDTNYIVTVGGDVFLINATDSNGYSFNYKFKIGQQYQFNVDSTAKDINGNFLIPAFSMTFIPEPYFRVQRIEPKNGATEVPYYSWIYIYFNSRVDTSIFSKIHISPDLAGQWRLSYDSSYVYYEQSVLGKQTTYTVTIDSGAQDKYGNRLPNPFISTFSTAPFKVAGSSPQDGSTNVSLNSSISLYCNAPIDTGTVRLAFRMNPTTAGYFSMYEGSSYFSFIPFNELLPDTTYTVTIDTTLQSKNGTKLSAQYQFSFRTTSFQVAYTYPLNGQTNVSLYYNIEVYFTASIDTGTVRGALKIDPAVLGRFTMGTWNFSFSPINQFMGDTTYMVTIDTTLRSRSGMKPSAPYTFSFSTEPFRVSSTYPFTGQTQVPLSQIITVTLNAFIDTSTLRASFSLRDSTGSLIDGGFLYYSHSPDRYIFDASSNFAPNMRYTAFVSSAMRAKNGSKLKTPYTFEFRTGN